MTKKILKVILIVAVVFILLLTGCISPDPSPVTPEHPYIGG